MTQVCRSCHTEKPEEAYRRRADKPGKPLRPVCRQCEKAARKPPKKIKRTKKIKKKEKVARLKKKYGLSLEVHTIMSFIQDKKCAICKEVPSGGLVVDHSHTTGKVRALLCSKCNLALGMFKDSPDLLRAAVRYLERHK
jgi:hypothetical protein